MVEFNIMQFNLLPEPTVINSGFLISVINWDCESIKEISAKIPEVNHICRVINKHFSLKTRSWQISVIADIT